MAAGNKHLGYKEALNAIEAQSPGTKHDFYFGFLARAADGSAPTAEAEQATCALHALRRADAPARSARSAGWSSGPRGAEPVQLAPSTVRTRRRTLR